MILIFFFYEKMSKSKIIFVSIEGCIAAGKSYLLDKLSSNTDFCFIDEPLDSWTNLKNEEGKCILELFYEDKKKYSFHFQMYALLTRFKNIFSAIEKNKDKTIFFTERSIYADRYIFFEMLKNENFISPIEQKIYLELFSSVIGKIPELSAVVNVNSSAKLCMDRLQKRNRKKGEETIPIEYLCDLIKYQNKWILEIDPKIKIFNCSSDDYKEVANFVRNL